MKQDLHKLQAHWDAEADAQVHAELAENEKRGARAIVVSEIGALLIMGIIMGFAILGMIR